MASGSDAFTESPSMRWDDDSSSDAPVRYAAFMCGAEMFDSVAFGISPPEMSTMDPQQRFLLELGYEALHGAGLPRGKLLESDTAVFVGVMSIEFYIALPHSNAYSMTGTGKLAYDVLI